MKVKNIFRRISVFVFLMAGFILVWNGVLEADIINGIACRVGEDIITIHEFEKEYEAFRRYASITGTPFPGKKQVMNKLIEEVLIEKEAEKRGIVVAESEVEKIIDDIMKQNKLDEKGFIEELKKEGTTLEELKRKYKIQLYKNRIINQMIMEKGIKVSESEIEKFYNDPKNRNLFKRDAIVSLSQVFISVPSDADFKTSKEKKSIAQKVYELAKGGGDFMELIEQYSDDPRKDETRGSIGSFTRPQLLSLLGLENVQTIFALSSGEVTPPIRLADGYYIFKINEKKDEKILSLDEARESIRSYIMKDKGVKLFNDWLKDKKENTSITYMIDLE